MIESVFEEPEIAGPGFINLRYKQEYLTDSIFRMAADSERLAVPTAVWVHREQSHVLVSYVSINVQT